MPSGQKSVKSAQFFSYQDKFGDTCTSIWQLAVGRWPLAVGRWLLADASVTP
jgi:hypothetical protein